MTREVAEVMRGMGRAAREAERVLALTSSERKNRALAAAAAALRERKSEILAANRGEWYEIPMIGPFARQQVGM